jgi:hypothetical protein
VALRLILVAAAGALLLAGCVTTTAQRLPDLRGQRLDLAEDRLDALRVGYDTAGGGAFGVVVRSHWIVCEQSPRPGTVAAAVTLTVERACGTPFVPGVTGLSLDEAEEILDGAGIDYAVEPDWGPVVVDSLWTVCSQDPEPGGPGNRVDLYVAHNCS